MQHGNRMGLVGVLLIVSAASSTYSLADSDLTLEEVVVTARKQPESLQDVPLSVTALTSERIQQEGLTDIYDVSLRSAGMNYGNFSDIKLSPISLRGVLSNAGSAGADPAVGTYIDEVFIGQGAGAMFDLYDAERVEVLRGPQGTLFGRNTIGGVISITTKRPTDQPEASAQFGYGSYGYLRTGAAVSGPIAGDRVSGNLAVIYEDSDGATENLWLNQDTNSTHHWTARGELSFSISDATSLLVSGEYFDVDQSPLAFETLSYNPDAILTQALDLFGLPKNTDPYDRKVYGDIRNVETLELKGISALLTTRAGEVDISNILSYRTHDYYARVDTDRSPLSFVYDGDPENVDRWSEELRFAWSTGSLQWLAGLYYYNQDSTNLSFIEVGDDLAALLGAPEFGGVEAGSNARMTVDSYAGFGSVIWPLSDGFDLTLGGRYTYERKTIDYTQSDPLGLLGGDFAVDASDSWSEFTPNASLRYYFNPDVMGYATISKGFKSGGFNDALGDANGIAFDPEQLWNYETGLKSELLEHRLILNAAVYYMDWQNIQITTDNPATPIYDPIILNAGEAHSTGVELELQAVLTERLSANASFAVQEAEYDQGTLPDGTPLNKIPFAPDYTGDLALEYSIPVGSGELSFLGEAVFRGASYLTPNNDPDGHVGSYQLYNARIGWTADSGRWSVILWGRNLGDEEVKQRLFDLYNVDIIGQKFIAWNEPRTFGVTLRFDYR